MKATLSSPIGLHTSALLLHPRMWRRSQVVRQRSAKPLFIGSIPIAASNPNLNSITNLAKRLRIPMGPHCAEIAPNCAKGLAQSKTDTLQLTHCL